MLNKLHVILKDPDCAGNIRCFTWAFVCVMVYFSVFLYGFGVLGLYSDVDNLLQQRNEAIIEKQAEFESRLWYTEKRFMNHRHKPFSGKIYFKPEPTTAK